MTELSPSTTATADEAKKLAAEIVVAYLQNSSVSPEDLPDLVRRVRAALMDDLPAQALAAATPATAPAARISVEESITPDYLISFEDGRRYRSLRRHLMAQYGMTPDDYRRKWGLPKDYPMVAPNYAKQRSEVAKRIGLGKVKPADETTPPGRRRTG